MTSRSRRERTGRWLLIAALVVTAMVYWPGLKGGWLFDDYPNIVENPGLQISHVDLASLTRSALSSPSSVFKRPLASLTFSANYLASGLHPYSWKATNVVIHLLNGIMVFLIARALLMLAGRDDGSVKGPGRGGMEKGRAGIVAALVAFAWMILPINLTGVLYVVQRMESLANLFVLLGLFGYIKSREMMLAPTHGRHRLGLALCTLSLVLATAVGLTAKGTAVMLPLYALAVEWIIFQFRTAGPLDTTIPDADADAGAPKTHGSRIDRGILVMFLIVLVIPLIVGLSWLLPEVLNPQTWATRDFTLGTRLLTESRIVVAYIAWTLVALPHWLSFYHDDVRLSTGLLHPWTTLASILVLGLMVFAVFRLRKRLPLVALGIALFLCCHLLTGTIIPLELVYEHRNYFASFGLMLAIVPLLAVPSTAQWAMLRRGLLGVALLAWTVLTANTAYAWGNPLRLAETLAARAPDSPRAEYSLGRRYIVASHYNPQSPYTPKVYAPLERAAKLPDSSILPQQALIFFNARMHRPVKPSWWRSLIATLKRRKPGVQDESSLTALVKCAREGLCKLSRARMQQAFEAAVSHPDTNARIWAAYGDYAWNVMGEHEKGLNLTKRAVQASPDEPAYHITLARMYIVLKDFHRAWMQVHALKGLDIGGSLEGSISALEQRLSNAGCGKPGCKLSRS